MEAHQFLKWAWKQVCTLALFVTVVSCAGCVSFVRIDGPYEGWVIDTNTKQPVEGVIVHGDWYKVWGTPGGASSEWYDSVETVTDKDGAFKLPGKGLLLLTSIDELHLTIFKAGYKQWPPNSWSGLKGKWPEDEVTWVGNIPIFKLIRLTIDERRKRGVEHPGSPSSKQRLLILESNKEMIETGRPSSTLLPVE
jgi:hypothetical protein